MEMVPLSASVTLPPCSFVVPCLNEAVSLADVLKKIEVVRPYFQELEVIVVDNGSDDDSVLIAKGFNVQIVHCQKRGYGAALKAGIQHARHEWIVFADADDTYDWSHAPKMVQECLARKAELTIGNRLDGNIEPGAMPFLHRWVGTPFLSGAITVLHGWPRGVRVGDCNSGMRVFSKSAYENWQVQSDGMEFASEMIIQALKTGASYHEVPILYRSARQRRSHLNPVRDGFRHLYCIVSNFSLRHVFDPRDSQKDLQ